MRRRLRWALGVAVVLGIVAIGSGGAVAGGSADWPGYVFDPGHSAYNAAATAITPSTVANLQPVWRFIDPAPVNGGLSNFWASPTVVNGVVYIGDGDGRVMAIRESDQTVLWSRFIGFYPSTTCPGSLGVYSTATVMPAPGSGELTVYENAPDGYVYALDAATGAVEWKTQLDSPSSTQNDFFPWGSPVVANGKLYVGISSDCDKPLVNAGVASFDQATGTPIAVWHSMVNGAIGASVWSTPTVMPDGSLLVTTGNDAVPAQTDWAESIVRLNGSTLSLLDAWQVPLSDQGGDADFGTTPTLFTATLSGASTPMFGACNKNGLFYAFRQSDLHDGPVWEDRLGTPPTNSGGKCIAGAIWDGSRLIVSGADPTTIGGVTYPGSVRSVDPATGAVLWQTGLPGGVIGTPTEDGGGLIAAPVFSSATGAYGVCLLRASDGALLAFIPSPSAQWSEPVFANGDLLVAGGSAVGLTAYEVTTPGAPLTTVSPSSVTTGSTKTITITGSGFSGTPTVFVSGFGVTPSSVHVTSSTQLTVTVKTVSNAALGPRNLVVTEPGPIAHTCSSCLSVLASTTTSIAASANPSILGSAVTFTATVAPSDGGGTVAFTADGSAIAGCSARPLTLVGGSEQSTCTTAALATGTHTVVATYGGDASYTGSTVTLAGGQDVQGTTTTTVSSSANPLAVGYPVTFTATVGGSDGGGSVAFTGDGAAIPGCGALPLALVGGHEQATCVATGLKVGTHTISAAYTGDAADASSVGTLAGGQITTAAVPGIPVGLGATILTTTSLTVAWNAVPGAIRYFLYEASGPSGPYTEIASPTTTSKTVTGLAAGTTYYFEVKANNGYTSSAVSAPLQVTTPAIPAPPAGLAASAASDTSIGISWISVAGATRYLVYQASVSGGPYTQIASTASTSKTVTGLTPGATYYFVVKASNGYATSPASTETSASTVTVPDAPTGLVASATSDTSVSVSWSAVAGATRYVVYQASAHGGPYTQVAATTTQSRMITGLISGRTYYFVVKASNGVAFSPASAEASATTASVPPAPGHLVAVPHSPVSVTLTWDGVAGALKYYVYEATVPGGPYTQVAVVAGSTSRTVGGLTSGTTYYFVVKAYTGLVFSAASNEASATPS